MHGSVLLTKHSYTCASCMNCVAQSQSSRIYYIALQPCEFEEVSTKEMTDLQDHGDESSYEVIIISQLNPAQHAFRFPNN